MEAISLTVSPIRDAQGKIIGASKVSRDITERKRAQARQQFLISELEHRARNLFAVIQSVINRTLVEGQTLAGAKEVLTGRLNRTRASALLACGRGMERCAADRDYRADCCGLLEALGR
jgi:signal transduction histidine kinase